MTIADTTSAAAKATITRAMKANAASTVRAISRSQVRVLKPRDAAFGVDAFEACRATLPAAADLNSVFVRFRFLAKAISGAEIERAERQDSQMPQRLYSVRLRRPYCIRHPACAV